MTKVSSFSIDGILGNVTRSAERSRPNVRTMTSDLQENTHDSGSAWSAEEVTRDSQRTTFVSRNNLKPRNLERSPNSHTDTHREPCSSEIPHKKLNHDVTEETDVVTRAAQPVHVSSVASHTSRALTSQMAAAVEQNLDDSRTNTNPLLRHPLADPTTLLNTLYPGLDQFVAMSAGLRPGMQPHFSPSYPHASPLTALNRLNMASLQARPDLILPYDRTAALRCKFTFILKLPFLKRIVHLKHRCL